MIEFEDNEDDSELFKEKPIKDILSEKGQNEDNNEKLRRRSSVSNPNLSE